MAFKMKGYTYSGTSPLKNPGEHKHPHEQTGYRPGDVMDESNSSAEMRRLAALDTEVEYEADKNNKEWQRRGDLNKARLKYAKSLGAPTSKDMMESEARRKSRQ